MENEQDRSKLDDAEMYKRIKGYNPPPLKDFYKRPYNSIFIIILLFVFGITFINIGIYKLLLDPSVEHHFPYFLLGAILLIPGGYYSFILVNIWCNKSGYTYELIPDLGE